MFREKGASTRGLALFRDIEVDAIDTFTDPYHRRLLGHNPEIQVVFGRDVLEHSELLLLSDEAESEKAEFVFHVDTGTGIVPLTTVVHQDRNSN